MILFWEMEKICTSYSIIIVYVPSHEEWGELKFQFNFNQE